MELKDFRRAYNARIREMGAQARAECLGVTKKTDYSGPDGAAGEADLLSVRTQGIGLVRVEGAVNGCIVHAPRKRDKGSSVLSALSVSSDFNPYSPGGDDVGGADVRRCGHGFTPPHLPAGHCCPIRAAVTKEELRFS